jgi:hypothetical protein
MKNRLYIFQVGKEVWGVTAEGFGLASGRMQVAHPTSKPVLVFSVFTLESHEVPINFSEVEKDETPSIILTPAPEVKPTE